MGKCFIANILFSLLCLFIAGCGGATRGAPEKTKNEAAQSCINCHGSQGADWQLSAHNTKNGATCTDCHDPHPGHPNTCNTCHNGQYGSNPSFVPIINSGAVCLGCHTGTISGVSVVSARFGNFSAMSFINSRSLPGGVTVFGKTGFHFYTSSAFQTKYADSDYFLHNSIGVDNVFTTGTLGPCLTCHVGQESESKRHLPIPVDRSGKIVSTVCAKCHSVAPLLTVMDSSTYKSKKDGYFAALTVLAKVLKDRGFSYTDTYPNFANSNWKTDFGASGGFGGNTGMFTMGAAFNFNLLWHDYGAFAHNSLYAKRLIFDSIDWIVNHGVMTGSIGTALMALPSNSSSPGELLFTKADNVTGVYYNDSVRNKAIEYLQGTSGMRP